MQLAKQTFVTKVKVTGNKKAIPQEVDSEVTKLFPQERALELLECLIKEWSQGLQL